jgi:hypothetical protein
LMSGLGEQLNAPSAVRVECQARGGYRRAGVASQYFRQHDPTSATWRGAAGGRAPGRGADAGPDERALADWRGVPGPGPEPATPRRRRRPTSEPRAVERRGWRTGRPERVAARCPARRPARREPTFRAAAEILRDRSSLSATRGESARLPNIGRRPGASRTTGP